VPAAPLQPERKAGRQREGVAAVRHRRRSRRT